MRKDVDASVAFARELAEAGDAAVAVLGKKMIELGDDIATDQSPLQLLAAAAFGLESARSAFVKGALSAAEAALAVRRGEAPAAVPSGASVTKNASGAVFVARNVDTIWIAGLVSYEALKKRMADSAYEPAEVRDGKERFGVVHIFFNHVGDTRFGKYDEVLVLASALPAGTGHPVKVKDSDNSFYCLAPAITGAAYFALKVFIDADNEEVVEFGRMRLGLDKVTANATKFVVSAKKLDVNLSGVVSAQLTFDPSAVSEAVAELGYVFGKVPSQPLSLPSSVRYPVITRTNDESPFLTWTWDFTAAAPPLLNGIADPSFWKPGRAMNEVLKGLDFVPRVSTWTLGLDGVVDSVDLVRPNPGSA